MCNNWICGLNMTICFTIIFIFVAFTSAARVTNVDERKETSNLSHNNNPPSSSASETQNREHVISKRAWNQLQGSWGKRSYDEEPTDEELEELQRLLMRSYSDQFNNRGEDNEYLPSEASDDANTMDKRAWNQMNNAWGKRDWNQLRGSGWGKREAANWNNMRGLWGKRAEKWNKLSSAWGRK